MENQRVIHGRTVTPQDVTVIRELLDNHPDWSRRRLSLKVCAIWNWRNAKEQLRDIACRTVLLRLHRAGEIVLPVARHNSNSERRHCLVAQPSYDTASIEAPLRALTPLEIIIPQPNSAEDKLFKCFMQRYHYLGFKHVPGRNMRYMVFDSDGRPVACLLFAAAAWKTATRDRFIGWSTAIRESNLALITNNARFLILPWVSVKSLASHILSRVSRRIRPDWIEKYGHPVHLLETFVDRSRYRGVCYRAANWINVGRTVGRTRNDRQHRIQSSIKDVYVYPLTKHFRRELCQ
jgi:hypothetical protein